MQLDTATLRAVGKTLDQHNIPVEDRRMLFLIDGIDYRLDAEGCWRFKKTRDSAGWTRCKPPKALRGLF